MKWKHGRCIAIGNTTGWQCHHGACIDEVLCSNHCSIRKVHKLETIHGELPVVEEDDFTYEKVHYEVKQAYTGLRTIEVDTIATMRYDELKEQEREKQEREKQEREKQERERMKQEEAIAKAIEEGRISNIKRQQEEAELVRKEQELRKEYLTRRLYDNSDDLTSKHYLEEWSTAMSVMSTMEIEPYGEGWVSKKDLYNTFGRIHNLSSQSAINNRFNSISHIFQTYKVGCRKYIRLTKPVSMKSTIDKRLQIVGNEKNAERKNTLTELPSAINPKINNRVLPASVVHSNSELADMIVKRVFLMITQYFEPVGEVK